jgi:hypothetical protein
MNERLAEAFTLLLQSSTPALATQAIKLLVTDAPCVRSPMRSHDTITDPAATNGAAAPAPTWDALRPRLRAIVIGTAIEEREAIAAELGVSPATLRNIIYNGTPGKAAFERIAQWLEGRPAPVPPRKRRKASRAKPRTRRAAALPRSMPAVVPDGHRLAPTARERLNFLIEADPQAVRKEGGIGLDAARMAASGALLEPEIIDRLAKFVGSGRPPAAAE